MTFAQLLRYYREGVGFNQEKVAELSKLSPSFISRLESGARMPHRETIIAIGRAMELSTIEIDRLLLTANYRPIAIGSAMFDSRLADLDDVIYASTPQIREEIGTMVTMALAHGRNALAHERATA